MRFVRVERHVLRVGPACDFSFQGLKSAKKLQPACLEDVECHSRGWSHQQIDEENFLESGRSLMKIRNRTGTRTLLWGHSSFDRERI